MNAAVTTTLQASNLSAGEPCTSKCRGPRPLYGPVVVIPTGGWQRGNRHDQSAESGGSCALGSIGGTPMPLVR